MSENPMIQWNVPKVLLEEFHKDPRILLKTNPAGLWPVPVEMLSKLPQLMAADKQFASQYQVVIMQK